MKIDLLLPVCVVACLACGHTEAGPPGPAAVAPSAAQPAPTRQSHMQTSFMRATQIRDAIIAGDLEGAKAAAEEFNAEDHYAVMPEDWKGWIERVRQHAGEVALASDLGAAAQGLASMALACGNCHHHTKQGPATGEQEALGHPERAAPDLATRMQRHQVATDELWLGLLGPSDALWKQGTVTLTRAEMVAPMKEGEPVDGYVASEVESVRTDATAARAAETHVGRAESYGNLLARCAGCHSYLRR